MIRRSFSRVRPLAAVAVLVALAASCSGDDGGDVIDLAPTAIGTCVDFGDTVGADVTELPEVPCGEEHSHEIYALAEVDLDTYPGFEALEADAQAQCLAAFEDYVGISAFDSELFFSWLVPTLTSWDKDDDRQIICLIGEGNGARLVGSVRNINR
ncbi:MAG: septum formation family protein [Ilumatobacteraceae bacterium]